MIQSEDRFFSKIEKSNYCWNWIGYKDKNGYGKFRYDNETGLAHRFSYEYHIGNILDGLTVDHLCGNRSCVNPLHLELVTLKENLRRGEGVGSRNIKKTHCPKGHPYSGENLYKNKRKNERLCRMCAKDRFNRWKNKRLITVNIK